MKYLKYIPNGVIKITNENDGKTGSVILKSIDMFENFSSFSDEFKKYLVDKYENNDWWNNKDEFVRVCFQVFEPRLVLYFDELQFGIDKILGRITTTLNFASRKVLDSKGLKGVTSYEEIKNKIKEIWIKDSRSLEYNIPSISLKNHGCFND